jgi:hypothetical protein
MLCTLFNGQYTCKIDGLFHFTVLCLNAAKIRQYFDFGCRFVSLICITFAVNMIKNEQKCQIGEMAGSPKAAQAIRQTGSDGARYVN